METTEIMTNEEVVEVTEEVVKASSKKTLAKVGVAGLAILGGVFIVKKVIKPRWDKYKASKNADMLCEETDDYFDDVVEESVESEN